MLTPRYAVVHCTDTPNNMVVTAAMVDSWHRERGWSRIGYHVLIHRDGTIERGRPINSPGAHVAGYNHQSLGVALVGRSDYPDDQMIALEGILLAWQSIFPTIEVVGHNDLTDLKTCPNFDVRAWWASLPARTWG